MDRASTDSPAPISLESHVLPPPAAGVRVRRRGQGYQRVDVLTSADLIGRAVTDANRAERRRALRTERRLRLPVAGLLAGPVALLLAGPAAAAGDPTTSVPTTVLDPTSTSTTVAVTTTTTATTVAPTTAAPPTVAPTVAPTTAAPTTVAPTTVAPTSPPKVTAPQPGTTTTTAARPTATVPATVVTAPAPTSTSSSTSSTTTVPGADGPLPVGDTELPPDTPADADPVAATASDVLDLHHDLVTATKALADLDAQHAAADAETARLETRVAELTASAFDLAAANRATGEVEVLRAAARADLDTAAAQRAGLAMRRALASTELDELAARYPAARLRLATLVVERAGSGADAKDLDAAWAGATDARLDVVFAALAQVGDPYVFAATGPDTFDCSGLTAFAWKAAGITLDHFTVTQRQQTMAVAEADLQVGDLVFNLDGPNGGHVMLSLGLDQLVVHAPAPGTLVSVSTYRATTGFGSPLADERDLGDAVSVTADDAR